MHLRVPSQSLHHPSPQSVLGLFLDNHDQPRFLSVNSDHTLLMNGLTYILFANGIPIIYQGTEQGFNGNGDPYNREVGRGGGGA